MTIAEKLTALHDIKGALKSAIEAKGVTVGEVPFAAYPGLVGDIEGGGGGVEIPYSARLTGVGGDPWHLSHPTATGVAPYAFREDASLASITLPLAATLGDNAFQGCTSLAAVDLPSVTALGNSAFSGCTSLAAVDLPSVTSVGVNAFHGCTSLAAVDLPSATTLASYAFQGCSALTSITLPSLAGTSAIGGRAFRDCTSLTRVDLDGTFTRIGTGTGTSAGYVFQGCTNLDTLIIRRTTGMVANAGSANSLADTKIASGDGAVYVPDALTATYQADPAWSPYTILPISELP